MLCVLPHLATLHNLNLMGDCGFNLFTLPICLLHTVLPSGGVFWAEMAGQQTGLNGREPKLA